MLRKIKLIQLAVIFLLTFCSVTFVSAQKTAVDKNALAKFEKSIEEGNLSAIERDLLNYVISNPKDAKGFALLARLRFAQNRLNEAKSLYQKALSLDTNSISAKINLALINFQTGNPQQAIADLNEISAEEITDDALRMDLARAFAFVGDCQKALTTIENLAVTAANSDALPVRAGCYLKSGDTEKLNSLIPSAKNLIKQNPAISIKFAVILSNGAKYEEAADILRAVVSGAPQNAEALILLAKAEIYLKDLERAKIHLNQASKINARSPDLIFVQALLESEQGNSSESMVLLEQALAANPDSPAILSQYVVTAMRGDQAAKAVQAAERLMQLNPNEAEFLYLHGAASLQKNNLSAAENSLKKFLEMRPQDSRGCLALGLTFAAQAEKLEAARQQLRRCVEINPKSFEAHYQLGLSYKAQGETAKAIEYFEETVKISPDYAAALRDLGSVYLQSGAEAKAKIVLEKAVALDPNDGDTHFQLSRLYNLTNETGLAKKHLELFQKLRNPNKNGM